MLIILLHMILTFIALLTLMYIPVYINRPHPSGIGAGVDF